MTRFLRVLFLGFLTVCGVYPAIAAPADWTLMIYMNGKNNLESDASTNFAEIAAVGSTDAVNVLVEMGRPKHHVATDPAQWSGVVRFRVKTADKPVPPGDLDLRDNSALSDKGSPLALVDRTLPARKYTVVIWQVAAADDRTARKTGSARARLSMRSACSIRLEVLIGNDGSDARET